MTDPAQTPAAEEPPPAPRPLLGWTYWAGLTFGLVCVLLGLVIGVWGSRLAPPPLPRPPATLPAEPAAPAPPRPAPAPDPRLAELAAQAEAQVKADAAAASVALAAVDKAAEGSAPFAGQVEAVARALPPGPDLDALRALALEGAPTRAALAGAYPPAAAQAVVAARAPAPGAGLAERAGYLLTQAVTVRRTSRLTGTDPDAVLARADRAIAAGDLAGALKALVGLPPAGRAAMAGWIGGAERRVEIEARLGALRAAVPGPAAAAKRAAG